MVLALIQARMGSTRLPGKVLLPAAGKPLLLHQLERLSHSSLIDKIIVATGDTPADRELADKIVSWGYQIFNGSEDDVLDRFYQAWKPLQAETVVRITGYCPLIDPQVTDKVIKRLIDAKGALDYVVTDLNWPDGLDSEAFKGAALERAWKEARLPSEREHVTPYIRNHPELFNIAELPCPQDLADQRWTLDEERDYRLIKAVFEGLYASNKLFLMRDILDFLAQHPDVSEHNCGIIRNEGYITSLKKDKLDDV